MGRWGDGEMGRWGDGEMVEDGTFFYTKLNVFDINSLLKIFFDVSLIIEELFE
ncbi:MAG: hypothetical protein F6K24_41920 [Okeania sp. SIO2D1]|nr:hypothetical protein [Okeania sp. SIO2D1]